MMTPQPDSLSVSSFSFAAGVGDASAVAERVSGQVERLVAEEMKKVTAALNGISEHTVKIDEVGWAGWAGFYSALLSTYSVGQAVMDWNWNVPPPLIFLGSLKFGKIVNVSSTLVTTTCRTLYLRITGKKPVAMLHSQSFIIIMIMTSSIYTVPVNIFRR